MKNTMANDRVTWRNWTEMFAKDLAAAASKAGIDISKLKTEHTHVDQTWGDRIALCFYGASEEINKRAAEYFHTWAIKYLEPVSSYNWQISIDPVEPRIRRNYEIGGSHWDKIGQEQYSRSVPIAVDSGFVVAYVYHPCAD